MKKTLAILALSLVAAAIFVDLQYFENKGGD